MRRAFVVADIHGCNRTFRQLLFNNIKLEKEDTIYLLGDYVDRGPDSKGVIDSILELKRKGFDIIPIKGNHEDMLLESINTSPDGQNYDWLEATLRSYRVKYPRDIPDDHLKMLETLPLYVETEKHLLVHAGLNFSLDDPITETSKECMLWNRKSQRVNPDKIGGKKIVVGHTMVTLDVIKKSIHADQIQLDNGCCMGKGVEGKGNLIALELNSGDIFVQKNIERHSFSIFSNQTSFFNFFNKK